MSTRVVMNDLETRMSIGAFTSHLAGGVISWQSKQQSLDEGRRGGRVHQLDWEGWGLLCFIDLSLLSRLMSELLDRFPHVENREVHV
jgi:hypothetical protein